MRGVYRFKRTVAALNNYLSPPWLQLCDFMTDDNYREAEAKPPFTAGRSRVCGHEVHYSDAFGFLHSVNEIFKGRVYEFRAKSDAPFIVDAGANIGLSVLFFKRLYPNARVLAFEPDDKIFPLLQRNVGALSDVDLHQSAAWTESTDLTFHSEGSLAGSSEIAFGDNTISTTVKAERLADFIRGRHVDFLKIDIEGAENAVLFDVADDLDGVDHLFFEYHSSPDKPQRLGQLLELVSKRGFRYVINGPVGPSHPFLDKMPFGFDLQLNVSCFRH